MKQLLMVTLAACITAHLCQAQQSAKTASPAGKWTYTSSSGKDLFYRYKYHQPELAFNDSTLTVSVYAGCNKIVYDYTIEGNAMTFGTMVNPNKACPDMEAEKAVIRFLAQVGSFRLEAGRLYLFDKTDTDNFMIFRK